MAGAPRTANAEKKLKKKVRVLVCRVLLFSLLSPSLLLRPDPPALFALSSRPPSCTCKHAMWQFLYASPLPRLN